MIPLKASIVKNPSAVYLQMWNPNIIQTKKDLTWNRLDQRQTWHGINGLDSPTAGYNINTRQSNKAMTWLLIENRVGHVINLEAIISALGIHLLKIQYYLD